MFPPKVRTDMITKVLLVLLALLGGAFVAVWAVIVWIAHLVSRDRRD
jgi:hypothetical protein